ncbi:MAG TPA: hypothetical protein VHP33_37695 [Polyangiaceae bacterium]|nr:hypothetical protein [Polyangiaceae bacterium]
MPEIRRAVHKKRPGVCYAVTNDGLELPVVDVTHPAFACALTDEKQQALKLHFLEEQRRFAQLPRWLRAVMLRFFMRGSRIGQGLRRAEGGFLDGMTTYLFKIGPKNLGSYAVPVDRRILMSLPAISVRLRLSDMARLLADGLAPRLAKDAQRPLQFVNIAGGPAMDSLNALLLLKREQPELLAERHITLHVLDGDENGPAFGQRALAALQAPGAPLSGLDVEFRHARYDWGRASELTPFLERARQDGALLVASSEGGLFEYGSDRDIVENLKALPHGSDAFVVGSVTRDDEVIRTLKLTSTAATKPRGLPVFAALAEQAGWNITRSIARPLSDQVLLEPATGANQPSPS